MHFAAFQVEKHGAPLRLLAPPGIGMLKKRCSIKTAKAMGIPREMSGYPIQNYSNTRAVACIYKRLKLLWRPIAGGDGIVSRDLISPTVIERVFAKGQ